MKSFEIIFGRSDLSKPRQTRSARSPNLYNKFSDMFLYKKKNPTDITDRVSKVVINEKPINPNSFVILFV